MKRFSQFGTICAICQKHLQRSVTFSKVANSMSVFKIVQKVPKRAKHHMF